jgi:hypothetical protein
LVLTTTGCLHGRGAAGAASITTAATSHPPPSAPRVCLAGRAGWRPNTSVPSGSSQPSRAEGQHRRHPEHRTLPLRRRPAVSYGCLAQISACRAGGSANSVASISAGSSDPGLSTPCIVVVLAHQWHGPFGP